MKIKSFLFVFFLSIGSAFADQSLSFPKEAKEFGFFTNIHNNLYLPSKPTGDKSPAVIVLPTCAGATQKNTPTLRNWIKLFVDNGYYVLMVEHLSPRTSQNNCAGRRVVSNDQMVLDTYDAVEHLSKIPGVDTARIFAVGYSLGAQTLGQIASAETHARLANDRSRPRAVASLYGGCKYKSGQYLFTDSNIPQLWLMGEKDKEAPVEACMPTINELAGKNNDFKWHVYSDGYHSWDNADLDGFTKTIKRENESFTVTYKHDKKITEDSQQRVLDFFNSFK